MFRSLLPVAILASFAVQTITAIPTITAKGAKFFANGEQFFLKGVSYQGTPEDPLVDTRQCRLDAESMASIGTNSIRVYHVNPWVNHDGCMTVFAELGIYVWLDLDTFNTTIDQKAPVWTETQFREFALVMDAFQKYDNIGGFWIGNEIINTAAGSLTAPYIKAATTDLKAYLKAKNYRPIPIGYSAADIAELRPHLQNYLACGDDFAQSIDYFGLNSYQWCGNNYYEAAGYANLQAMTVGYNIPIFFSETGCNVGGDRLFQDQSAIFGPKMIDTWSGSIVYSWVQEANDYGVVTYPNGVIYSGAPIPIQPDFDNLKREWQANTPRGVAEATYKPSLAPPACPKATDGWLLEGNPPLPTLGPALVRAVAAQKAFEAQSSTPSTTPPPSSTSSSSSTQTPPTTSAAQASEMGSATSASAAASATTSSSGGERLAAPVVGGAAMWFLGAILR